MTDPSVEIVRLSSRISALEKANRRWKLAGLLALVFLIGTALLTGIKSYAQLNIKKPGAATVVAHEFVLMSSHGQVLGRMAVVKGRPKLEFYTANGRLWWFAPPKFGVNTGQVQLHGAKPK